jgi:hypothetical protein
MIDSDWSEEAPVRLFSSVHPRKNAGAAENRMLDSTLAAPLHAHGQSAKAAGHH